MSAVFIRWDKLVTNFKPYLVDLPQAAADHGRMEALLAKIRALFSEQEVHGRRIAELIRLREDAMREARDLRNRLVAHLQARFGPTSERLKEFALKPRKSSLHTGPRPEDPPAPEPSTTVR